MPLSLSADRPITDLAADCLGYRPFAKNIATILDNATTREDCLVLGIHGEWGSGKTSAINLVVKELEKKQEKLYKYPKKLELFFPFSSFVPDGIPTKTEIIHFSPWLFSNQENLTTAFFHELEKQLDNTWGNIKGFFKTISALTLPSLEALSYLNPTTSKLVGNTTQHLIKNLQKRPSLEQTKQALNKALKAQKRPILIIIDDIDRLPADEMRQMFRMVKSVADLPYVTYLLGFDRKIVERALEKDTDLEGPQWTEKIVQGSFDLPKISSYHLEVYLKKQLKNHHPSLYKKTDFLDEIDLRKFVYPELTTCRQINRLINNLIVGRQNLGELVSISEFIIITTWRLYNPRLYKFIKNNKKLFCTTFNPTNPKIQELENIIIDQNLLKEFKERFLYETTFERFEITPSITSSLYFDNYFTYDNNPGELLSNKYLIDIEDYILNDIGTPQKNLIELYQTPTKTESNNALLLLQEWKNNIQFYRDEKIEKIINFLITSTFHIPKKTIKQIGFFLEIDIFISQCFQSISTSEKREALIIKTYQKYALMRPLTSFFIEFICFPKESKLQQLINNQKTIDAIENSYEQKVKLLLELNDKVYLLNADIITIISYFNGYQYVNSWLQKEIYIDRMKLLTLIERLIDIFIAEKPCKTKRIIYYINQYVRNVIDFSSLKNAVKSTFKTFNNNNEKEIVTLFLNILSSNDFSTSEVINMEQ